MKSLVCIAAALCLLLAGCSGTAPDGDTAAPQTTPQEGSAVPTGPYTIDTPIQTVMDDPVFGDYGRLLFPADTGYWSGDTLGSLRLTWYNNIDPEETVAIVNHLHTQAAAGETVFYDIYTPEEKAADPDKTDTGLFFSGDPGGKVAFCNAGGGFAYVGAMQDSFPHALELSRRGYNAFALLYRPGAQTACEDLARAITFVSDHAQELQVDLEGYSLWGRLRRGEDGGLAGVLWPGGLRRGRPGPGRGGDHAVHRPQRLHRERSPHLRLRGGAGRHCQLADHGAPPPGPVCPGHPHGVPPLPRLTSWLRPGHRHRGGGVAGPGGGLLGGQHQPKHPPDVTAAGASRQKALSLHPQTWFPPGGDPFGVSAFPFWGPGKPL